jgi:hypothetical protein
MLPTVDPMAVSTSRKRPREDHGDEDTRSAQQAIREQFTQQVIQSEPSLKPEQKDLVKSFATV